MKRYGQTIGVDPRSFERHKEHHAAVWPEIQEWWSVMEPMQRPVKTRGAGEWWANMEEVFHLD